ncbi:MAG: hypothetical protein DRI90_25990 [Deltaproteobacteria bacterium]|nr:MAG: hypothetical protein DRI90_25990 [Deltaproteobacteria bacterium]
MPNRVTAILLVLFVIAVASFGLGLLALSRAADLLALLLCVLGALSLAALGRVARLGDGGAR